MDTLLKHALFNGAFPCCLLYASSKNLSNSLLAARKKLLVQQFGFVQTTKGIKSNVVPILLDFFKKKSSCRDVACSILIFQGYLHAHLTYAHAQDVKDESTNS